MDFLSEEHLQIAFISFYIAVKVAKSGLKTRLVHAVGPDFVGLSMTELEVGIYYDFIRNKYY